MRFSPHTDEFCSQSSQAQHGVLSRRQALCEGLSPSAIDRRLAAGEWVRVFQGVYRLAGVQTTWEQRVMAGCLAAGPDAVASHRSAAALHGMPGAPRWVEVMVPRSHQVRVGGVIAHRTRLFAPEDVGRLRGIPATTPGRTIADLAGVYSKEKLGPMLDYALARRLVTLDPPPTSAIRRVPSAGRSFRSPGIW